MRRGKARARKNFPREEEDYSPFFKEYRGIPPLLSDIDKLSMKLYIYVVKLLNIGVLELTNFFVSKNVFLGSGIVVCVPVCIMYVKLCLFFPLATPPSPNAFPQGLDAKNVRYHTEQEIPNPNLSRRGQIRIQFASAIPCRHLRLTAPLDNDKTNHNNKNAGPESAEKGDDGEIFEEEVSARRRKCSSGDSNSDIGTREGGQQGNRRNRPTPLLMELRVKIEGSGLLASAGRQQQQQDRTKKSRCSRTEDDQEAGQDSNMGGERSGRGGAGTFGGDVSTACP